MRMQQRSRIILTVFLTFAATLAGVLLVLNFSAGEKKVEQQLPRLYSTSAPQFQRAMGSLLGPGILAGNQVTELLNGDQIFPAMLEAIDKAQRSITFESYIYWSGDIGQRFADALASRARAGVKVHVLLDWVGSAKVRAQHPAWLQTDRQTSGLGAPRGPHSETPSNSSQGVGSMRRRTRTRCVCRS